MHSETTGYHLTATINNFNLSYNDTGEGRIPVIFLHGFPFDKTMWHGQIEHLKHAYRLISIDIRGFGKSIDEDSELSIDLFGDDLIALMNHLCIKKAVLCGLSMGGYIALNVQQRFPGRAEALILCDTQCKADTSDEKQNRMETIKAVQSDGTTAFNEGFIKKVFHKDSLKHRKDAVKQLRTVVFANTPHIICQGLGALAGRSETCSMLGTINIPTLIICGRDDEVTPPALSEYMHENIKGSMLRILEEAGHVSNLEQPAEFNKQLSAFLSSLGSVSIEYFSWDEKSDHKISF
jgi:3-oxoadipate enol-lactonase